jgi:hypothetical protein
MHQTTEDLRPVELDRLSSNARFTRRARMCLISASSSEPDGITVAPIIFWHLTHCRMYFKNIHRRRYEPEQGDFLGELRI